MSNAKYKRTYDDSGYTCRKVIAIFTCILVLILLLSVLSVCAVCTAVDT